MGAAEGTGEIMIELRWVKVPDATTYIGPNAMRLEYRQWKVRVDASGAVTPLPFPVEWTDWMTVPTVNEQGGDSPP